MTDAIDGLLLDTLMGSPRGAIFASSTP